MNNSSSRSKSQLFLLEFTIVVLFFAICATICVSAFVKADRMSEINAEKSQALILLQSAAEIIKAADYESVSLGEKQSAEIINMAGVELQEYFSAVEVKSEEHTGQYEILYDENYQAAENIVQSKYTMNIEIAFSKEGMLEANLTMYEDAAEYGKAITAADKAEPLSKLVVKKYIPVI